MKKFKKGILNLLKNIGKRNSKKNEKFSNMVLNLSLQKIDSDSLKFDGKAVYTADMSTLVYVFDTDDSFNIPEGVEIIGKMAFHQKKHLKKVVIPSTVKKIEKEAFIGCTQLDDLSIPATVESIKNNAFSDCYCLHNVTFEGELKHLSRHTFDDCDNLHCIIVPTGSSKTFKKALHISNDDDSLTIIEKEIKKPLETKTTTPRNIVSSDSKPKTTKPKTSTTKPKTAVSKPKTDTVKQPKTEPAKQPKAEPVKQLPEKEKPSNEATKPETES